MRLVTGIFLAGLLALPSALADQAVVLKGGAVVKCKKFEVKGNVYVLTMPDGKLQSMRADKVDAEATATYEKRMTEEADAKAKKEASAKAAASTKKAETKPPAASKGAAPVTDADLAKYKGTRDESTVTAEGSDMPSRADYERLEAGKSGSGSGEETTVDPDIQKYGTLSEPTPEGEALFNRIGQSGSSEATEGSDAPPEE